MAAPEKIRLFVAVFPPAEIVMRLAEAGFALSRGLVPTSVAWTRFEHIHLTLNFLGSFERNKVPELERAVTAACRHVDPFPVKTRGLGCFPSPARPRIFLGGMDGGLPALEALKRALDTNLGPLGYVPDTQPFRPHLTIGRVKQWKARDRRHLAETLPQWREADFGIWTVARVDLMQSVLAPTGSEYTRLQSFHLPASSASQE